MSAAFLTLDELCRSIAGLQAEELRRWMDQDWVRPQRSAGQLLFGAMDVARVRLIVELRRELELEEASLPVVLGLLDQLYEERRRLRALCDMIERSGLGDPLRERNPGGPPGRG